MDTKEFPVNRTLEVIGGKWRPQVYCTLEDGAKRFSEIERAISGINRKVLTDQLRELERLGIVSRTVFPGATPHVEYELTEEGETLQPLMKGLCAWGDGKC